MPKLYTPKQIVKLLLQDGWIEVRTTGSHKQFKHSIKKGTVPVPYHGNKAIPIGTTKSIFRLAGLEY